jgi:hypothetical protein
MQLVREVSIRTVDVVNHAATGVGRFGVTYYINTAYYTGAVQVTPTIGDQWMIQKILGDWRLLQKIPFNDPNGDPNSAPVPTQGSHIIGSGQGPVEMMGTQINMYAPLSVQAVSTGARPTASSVPAGTHIYDSTLGKPIWSNGTNWTDAAGTVV